MAFTGTHNLTEYDSDNDRDVQSTSTGQQAHEKK